MEWIDTLFVEHTALQAVVVVALICAAGMALGKIGRASCRERV